MSVFDYTYDPEGVNPDNLIVEEVHSTAAGVGILPVHGPFFYDSLEVEGLVNGQWKPLIKRLDYRPGLSFTTASLNTGKTVVSYFVLQRKYTNVRIRYQTLGQYQDTGTLNLLASLNFDRSDPVAWLSVVEAAQNDVSDMETQWKGLGEAEAVNQGLVRIKEAIAKLKSESDKATLSQMTALETRQSQLEALVGNSDSSVDEIAAEFAELWELFHILEDYFINGGKGNTAYPDGYLYNSESADYNHVIEHTLDTRDLHMDFWELNYDGKYVPAQGVVRIESNSRLVYESQTPVSVIGILRPRSSSGFTQTFDVSSSATVVNLPHGLNSGFLGVTVLKQNDEAHWVATDDYYLSEVDENNLRFANGTAGTYKVIIEPPTPNAFAYKSQPAAREHTITHYLETTYFAATLWQQDENGDWYTVSEKPTTQLVSLNHIKVTLPLAGNIKVILHPVGIETVKFDQDLLSKQIQIEDTQIRIEERLAVVSAQIEALKVPTSFDYHADITALVHTVSHDLNEAFLRVNVWVEQDDGSWVPEEALVRPTDNNTLQVTLTESRRCHVRVSTD